MNNTWHSKKGQFTISILGRKEDELRKRKGAASTMSQNIGLTDVQENEQTGCWWAAHLYIIIFLTPGSIQLVLWHKMAISDISVHWPIRNERLYQ